MRGYVHVDMSLAEVPLTVFFGWTNFLFVFQNAGHTEHLTDIYFK